MKIAWSPTGLLQRERRHALGNVVFGCEVYDSRSGSSHETVAKMSFYVQAHLGDQAAMLAQRNRVTLTNHGHSLPR